MPYKVRTTHNIDTFIGYEPGVFRGLLYDELRKTGDDRLETVLRLLKSAEEVPVDMVPEHSLLREFIDGEVSMP